MSRVSCMNYMRQRTVASVLFMIVETIPYKSFLYSTLFYEPLELYKSLATGACFSMWPLDDAVHLHRPLQGDTATLLLGYSDDSSSCFCTTKAGLSHCVNRQFIFPGLETSAELDSKPNDPTYYLYYSDYFLPGDSFSQVEVRWEVMNPIQFWPWLYSLHFETTHLI
jgi:hypothetical protein